MVRYTVNKNEAVQLMAVALFYHKLVPDNSHGRKSLTNIMFVIFFMCRI